MKGTSNRRDELPRVPDLPGGFWPLNRNTPSHQGVVAAILRNRRSVTR